MLAVVPVGVYCYKHRIILPPPEAPKELYIMLHVLLCSIFFQKMIEKSMRWHNPLSLLKTIKTMSFELPIWHLY
ncbi:hypothetical protein ATZ36_05555 [Candidatus Endomicrobiellum trichonymphae]|uniref:Uncharacterized protein n=1 Tax=Endomicrobium trichonymphae TaxID=1408204 RepID=A0A1E5III0_ENDTX|nr:hypothetical protein ATZ36_05555 [Candidatus Endomicrobium trichonymphae]